LSAKSTLAVGPGKETVAWSTVVAVFCNNCGHRNPEGVNFCSSCGNALLTEGDDATITLHPADESGETSDEEHTATLVEIPHGAGVLVVTRGSNMGTRYLLGEHITRAGRHPESDIFLDDITVSRRHVEITHVDGGTFIIRDVGSLNGTYVNRERIDEASLLPGDEVQIGKFKLLYLVAGNE
jgi:pSer/pThr/pTyr-binding forkhead associated (FHA) protein